MELYFSGAPGLVVQLLVEMLEKVLLVEDDI